VNRKIILLNVALLALAGWLFWMLRERFRDARRHEQAVLNATPQPRPSPAPPPIPLPKPPSASDYVEIAQKTLFSRDRNPNVIVEPPPPPPTPPPPPPMPDLPVYYGEMNFGDHVVLLRLPKDTQKNYHAGDKVGPFLLVSFTREKIVFDWDGKLVERDPETLREKEAVQAAESARQRVAAPAPSAVSASSSPNVKSVGGDVKGSEKLGKDNGAGVRQCVAGDTSPAGTVEDGYRKEVTSNLFGDKVCLWRAVNP
jgi:hypothetical protein